MPFTDKPQEVLQLIGSQKEPFPIFILMGEEEYFTDKIEKKILSTYLPNPDERDFNLSIMYANDCTVEDIIASCRRYPMGGTRTVVLVREAQALVTNSSSESGTGQPLSSLLTLIKHPNPYNILVVSIKGGKRLNRRLQFVKELEKKALLVDSKAIRDYQITPYIAPIAAEHGLVLTPEAIQVVAQRIGTDLVRMDSELEKLSTALPMKDRQRVTPEMVMEFTGWNKEYSPFDLRNALAYKHLSEAVHIALSLAEDEKRVPVQMILPQIFSYFANLIIAFYAPNRNSEASVMQQLGITNRFFVKEYMAGLNNYSPYKVLSIIKYIRKCDARSKGVYGDESTSKEILLDLVLFAMN